MRRPPTAFELAAALHKPQHALDAHDPPDLQPTQPLHCISQRTIRHLAAVAEGDVRASKLLRRDQHGQPPIEVIDLLVRETGRCAWGHGLDHEVAQLAQSGVLDERVAVVTPDKLIVDEAQLLLLHEGRAAALQGRSVDEDQAGGRVEAGRGAVVNEEDFNGGRRSIFCATDASGGRDDRRLFGWQQNAVPSLLSRCLEHVARACGPVGDAGLLSHAHGCGDLPSGEQQIRRLVKHLLWRRLLRWQRPEDL
mmetsp:Transcript_31041/g.103758  ORF Transcript_31041/g.103758 Transcript_31041/m.103758 type:complete len:251 (-) Transcript_31041:542-1294(-)